MKQKCATRSAGSGRISPRAAAASIGGTSAGRAGRARAEPGRLLRPLRAEHEARDVAEVEHEVVEVALEVCRHRRRRSGGTAPETAAASSPARPPRSASRSSKCSLRTAAKRPGLAALDVVVDRPLADLGAGGDLVDGGALVAVLGERGARRVQDRVVEELAGLLLPARHGPAGEGGSSPCLLRRRDRRQRRRSGAPSRLVGADAPPCGAREPARRTTRRGRRSRCRPRAPR